jgi:hypothetical protein
MLECLPGGQFFGQLVRRRTVGGLTLSETRYAPGSSLPRHSHEHGYFCLVRRGTYREEYGGRQRSCGPLTLAYHPPGELHAEQFGSCEVWSFNIEVAPTWPRLVGGGPLPLERPFDTRGEPLVGLAVRLFHEYTRPDAASPLIIDGLTLELFGQSARAARFGRTAPPPPWLERVRDLLTEHCTAPPGLAELAAEAGVHPGHLAAAFRRHFGCPVGEFTRRRRVERLAGNVGYLELDGFLDAEAAAGPAAAAMTFLANTDALIIDLRRNGGGSPHGVALLCSYLFDAEKPVHLNSLYWRRGNRTEEFWTRKDVAGPRYVGKDVYVLTSARTFSAAEEFTYNLQCLKRATVVGETTGGGAHPGGGFPLGEHFVMFVPTGRAINPITKTNWEGIGVKPDLAVPADKALEAAHERAVQKLLEKVPDEDARRLIRMDLERDRERRRAGAAK